MEQETPAGSI